MKRTWIILGLILLTAAAGRGLYSFRLGEPKDFYQYDGNDYADLSRNLYDGKGYSISYYRWFEPRPLEGDQLHPEVHRPPLLPVFGAMLHCLPVPWETAARGLQVALGTACVLWVFLAARRLFDDRWALAAAGIMAVYPYAVFYSARWSTESLFCLALLVTVWLAQKLAAENADRRASNDGASRSPFRGGRKVAAAMCGIAAALACLVRPNGLAVAAGMAVWIALAMPKGLRARSLGLYLLGAAAILAPWTIRNYRVAGVATPVTAFGPYNCWLGNNERMYRMYRNDDSPRFLTEMHALYDEDSAGLVRQLQQQGIYDVPGENRFWADQAMRFIRENPGKTAYIWIKRLWHYWKPWPNRNTADASLFWLSAATVTPLWLLGAAGIALRWRRQWRAVVLLLIPPLAGMLAAAPTVMHLRLRFPLVDPFFAILSAGALAAVAERLKKRTEPQRSQRAQR